MTGFIKKTLDLQGKLPDKWKSGWQPWIRPNLTSNTDYGVVSCLSSIDLEKPEWTGPAYAALDGSIDLSNDTDDGFVSFTTKNWWKWELPHEIKIQKLTLWKDTPHLATQKLKIQLLKNSKIILDTGSFSWGKVNSYEVSIPDVICDTIRIEWLASNDVNSRVFLKELEIDALIKKE